VTNLIFEMASALSQVLMIFQAAITNTHAPVYRQSDNRENENWKIAWII
jgi:hypothetical protein